jgi:baculoviral IAP repeat-containing protein 6
VSSTMDARLEYGLDTNVEMLLRRLTLKSSINLFASLPQVGNKDSVNVVHEIPPWPENILNAWTGSEYQLGLDTNRMLMDVFENIFMDLHLEDSWMNLEQVLQLWLSLNGEVIDASGNCSFNSGKLPKIPFGEKAIYGLLKALATHPNIQIRGWCLGFQCLIYASKPIANVDGEFIREFF